MTKTSIIALVVVIIILGGIGAYFLTQNETTTVPTPVVVTPVTPNPSEVTPATTTDAKTPVDKTKTVIGTSVEKRDIVAYHYGEGTTELLFVGGIHGGYEWNTSVLAYELMDYLKTNPDAIPDNVKVTVIPVLNPDGLAKVVKVDGPFAQADVSTSATDQVAGRFNANTVDLNRNFDCDWKASGVWQTKPVSGGSKAFSEPESQALKNYVEDKGPTAAVVWYSAAGGVYASSCGSTTLPDTTKLMNTFATASKYPAHATFDSYEISGDMVNWLARQKIPAISVLLTNHTDSEWSKNKAGIDAVLKSYAK